MRWWLIPLTSMLFGVLAIVSCNGLFNRSPGNATPLSSGGTASPALVTQQSTPTATPPRRITIGLPIEPKTLAAPPNDGEMARLVGNLLFNQLVGLDARMQPYADLALDVPTVGNGGARLVGDGDARHLEVTIRLRPGVRWSDGTPLTANDVVFSWRIATNAGFGPPVSTERRIESASAINDSTVQLNYFSERSAREAARQSPNRFGFLADQRGPVLDSQYSLGLPNTWIYPAHILAPLVNNDGQQSPQLRNALTTSPFARAPIGSGPYVLSEWVPGQILRLKSRPADSRPAPVTPLLDLRLVNPETSVAPDDGIAPHVAWLSPTERFAPLVTALITGAIDVMPSVAIDSTSARGLRGISSTRIDVRSVASNQFESLHLNLDSDILRDVAVRQALAFAIDRNTLIAALGGAEDDRAVWQRGALATAYPFDPQQANQVLDGAGWTASGGGTRTRAGKPLRLELVVVSTPPHTRLAALLREQFARVGVDLVVQNVPTERLFDRSGPLAQRAFDLALFAINEGNDPIAALESRFVSTQVPSQRTGWTRNNFSGLRDRDVDQLIDASHTELDATRLVSLRAEIERKLISAIPEIPLFAFPRYLASRASIRGLQPGLGDAGDTWNSQLWSVINP